MTTEHCQGKRRHHGQRFSILQVSTHDIAGGAEKIAWNLHHSYLEAGYPSCLAVGFKHSDDRTIIEIPRHPDEAHDSRQVAKLLSYIASLRGKVPGIRFFSYAIQLLYGQRSAVDIDRGRENFHFPGSRNLLTITPRQPDIVHLHNLHGNYFDLRFLPELCKRAPVIMTLHDAWLLSGHCAHSFDCNRWQTGCGQCPDLTIDPAIKRDSTAFNWRRKRDLFARCRLYVATPSKWLKEKVGRSILSPAIIDMKVIPNGIDLATFSPADKGSIRAELGIPSDSKVLLFTANSIRKNIWKDFETMRSAVAAVANRANDTKLLFLAVGEDGPDQIIGKTVIRFVPFQKSADMMAKFYQAADIYIHAAKADTFPTSILEAMACGTPVVATAVGGIPEQVRDGESGRLVQPGDATGMAEAIEGILANDIIQRSMSEESVRISRGHYDLKMQAAKYLEWYGNILSNNSGQNRLLR